MLLSLLLLPAAAATIYTTNPVASTKATGGQVLKVEWTDDGAAPRLDTIGPCSVDLCIGSTTKQTCIQNLGESVDVSAATSISTTIDPSVGEDGEYYFVKYSSRDHKEANGQAYTQFSARFSISGMTGTFTPEQARLAADSGTSSMNGASSASASSARPSASSSARASTTSSALRSSASAASASASASVSAAPGAAPGSGAGKVFAPVMAAVLAGVVGVLVA